MNGTLTRKTAARYLNISLPTLDCYLHRADNPLPAIKAGKKYIIPAESLDRWLAEEARRQMDGRCNA